MFWIILFFIISFSVIRFTPYRIHYFNKRKSFSWTFYNNKNINKKLITITFLNEKDKVGFISNFNQKTEKLEIYPFLIKNHELIKPKNSDGTVILCVCENKEYSYNCQLTIDDKNYIFRVLKNKHAAGPVLIISKGHNQKIAYSH